jgi:hypothetical protein
MAISRPLTLLLHNNENKSGEIGGKPEAAAGTFSKPATL